MRICWGYKMIKTKTVNREIYEYYKYCDICGVLIHEQSMRPVPHCHYCHIDLCEDCIEHEDKLYNVQYRRVWCKRCWELHQEYTPKIKQLKIQQNQLFDTMIRKCKSDKPKSI
jgi:hypothetical protein